MGRIWDQKYWQTQRLGARFVAAQDSKTARRYLDLLERQLMPALERTLATQSAVTPELRELAVGELYQHLTHLRESGGPLPELERLAEAAAYASLAQHFKETNAEYRRLQLLTLYSLRNRADRFFLGKSPADVLLTGIPKARPHTTSRRWSRLQDAPRTTSAPLRVGLDPQATDYLPQLLERLLAWLGHQVPVVALVCVIAALSEAPNTEQASAGEQLLLAEKQEALYLLRELWEDIQTLSTRQRLVLLLGARDASGQSLLLLFCQLGVTSEASLAQSLEVGPRSFPMLLRELPCDEARLSELVKLPPEAVRQLALSARTRLRTQLTLWGQG